MRGAIPPFPQYVFTAWCLVKLRGNFTFTLLISIIIWWTRGLNQRTPSKSVLFLLHHQEFLMAIRVWNPIQSYKTWALFSHCLEFPLDAEDKNTKRRCKQSSAEVEIVTRAKWNARKWEWADSPFILIFTFRHISHLYSCWYLHAGSRDSSVGTALGYGLDDGGSRVRFLVGSGNFSLHHRVQTGSGAHPASYSMRTRGSFPGGKAAGAWSWPLTSI
jgi:hypothetical protein